MQKNDQVLALRERLRRYFVSFIKRLGLFVFAIIIADILVRTLPANWFPAGLNVSEELIRKELVSIHMINTAAICLLFRNRTRTGLYFAFATAVLCFFLGSGLWRVALGFAALTVFMIHSIALREKSLWNGAFVFLLCIGLISLKGNISLLTYYVAGIMGIIGIIYIKKKNKQAAVSQQLGARESEEVFSKEEIVKTEEEERLGRDYYQSLISQLESVRNQLPDEFVSHVNVVIDKSYAILDCMDNDPFDVIPGGRFLNRYLDSILFVVNDFVKLSAMSGQNMNQDELYSKTKMVLGRLEQAFSEQHIRLLENNRDDLHANLNVLDKMLDIEGIKK